MKKDATPNKMFSPELTHIDLSHLREASDIKDWAKNFLNINLLPWQEEHLMAITDPNREKLSPDVVLAIGQRGGKTIAQYVLASYVLHKFLMRNVTKNRNVRGWYTMTLVGSTFDRALQLSFKPLKDVIERTLWFQLYHATLDHYSTLYSRELYVVGEEYITYSNVGLFIHPMSPNKRLLRGDTRLYTSFADFSWYPVALTEPDDAEEDDTEEDDDRADAMDAYVALSNSLATLYTDRTFKDLVFAVWDGSPSSMFRDKDPLMALLRGENYAYKVHLATWEANPNMPLTGPVISEGYIADFDRAERDFGAYRGLVTKEDFVGGVNPFEILDGAFRIKGKIKVGTITLEQIAASSADFTRTNVDDLAKMPDPVASYNWDIFAYNEQGKLLEEIKRAGIRVAFDLVAKTVSIEVLMTKGLNIWSELEDFANVKRFTMVIYGDDDKPEMEIVCTGKMLYHSLDFDGKVPNPAENRFTFEYTNRVLKDLRAWEEL